MQEVQLHVERGKVPEHEATVVRNAAYTAEGPAAVACRRGIPHVDDGVLVVGLQYIVAAVVGASGVGGGLVRVRDRCRQR